LERWKSVVLTIVVGVLFAVVACGSRPGGEAQSQPADAARTAAGPIDVCSIVTATDAEAVLGPLPMQPPAKTDNVGFGIRACLYVGPALSGQGAQTVFARLTVQAGSGKDAPDLMQMDADKRKATIDLPGVGDAAKRNAAGSFVWARQGGVLCTAEISNGLPAALTADSAASQLGALCRKVLTAAKGG
jgi:hypothetical protein